MFFKIILSKLNKLNGQLKSKKNMKNNAHYNNFLLLVKVRHEDPKGRGEEDVFVPIYKMF